MGDPQSFHGFGNNTAARYGWNALAIPINGVRQLAPTGRSNDGTFSVAGAEET